MIAAMESSLTDEEYPKAGLFGGKVGGLPPVEPASGVERAPHGRHEDPSAEEAQVEVRAARFATVGMLRKAGSSVWPPDGRAGHVRGTLRP